MTKKTKRPRAKRGNLILTDKLIDDLNDKATLLADNTLKNNGLSISISTIIESIDTSIDDLSFKLAVALYCLEQGKAISFYNDINRSLKV